MTSLRSTPLELLPTPPFPSRRSFPSTPLSLSTPLSPSSTSPPSGHSPPLPQPLFLDLSLPHPHLPTSLPCSDSSESTLPHPSPQTANGLRNKPQKRLVFHSPLPKGEGVKQALAWNQEQLLDLRRLWELRRQRRVDQGLVPMTQPPPMISDAALGVENRINTATATPPLSLTHPSTSPLEAHCGPPFSPTAWRGLTSIVRKPQRWQLTSSMPLRTTKMPLRFRQSPTTGKSSRGLSPKASASQLPPLPKGWVYAVEEVGAEVKAEVTDPSLYHITSTPLTRTQRNHARALADPYRRHHRASSIIEDRLSFPSVSALTPAVKRRRVTSGPTSTPLTPL
jgi:hypothetical protein